MKKIGFIGLGVMGKPMAKNLLAAGYPLTVHNRSRPPVDELAALEATPATSSREVAERSDVVITMLPDTPDVELVVLGPKGVLEGTRPGSLLIDMSTVSPVATRRIAVEAAAKGVKMLDAPVSGGDVGAKEGTLSIMVGGEREVFEECFDIFRVLGKKIVYVGPSGMGQTVKACNQIVVALTLEAMAEALVLAAKAGLDPQLVVDVLSGGAARCWALEVRAPRVLKRDFTPGFRVKLHHKDLGIALEAARELGVPLPVTALVHQMFGALIAAGRENYDHSGIITLLEDLAGVEVRKQEG